MTFEIEGKVAVKASIEKGDVVDGIVEIRLPDGVKAIGAGAFSGVALTPAVMIADGAEEIGASAFEGHPELRSVSIPPSASKVGPRAFAACPGLSNVDFTHRTAFADDCFAGDESIKWLRKDGEIAKCRYFPRDGTYAIMVKDPGLSTSRYDIYRGKFHTSRGFPNGRSDPSHPPLYFCEYKADGGKALWYDTLLEWAVRGARYQAMKMTPREFLRRDISPDGDSEITVSEFGVIMGICFSGIKYISIVLGKRRNEKMPVKFLAEGLERYAPSLLRRFEEVAAHQDEVYPADRDFLANGLSWGRYWSDEGKTAADGMSEVFQILKAKGHLYDYNDWAY